VHDPKQLANRLASILLDTKWKVVPLILGEMFGESGPIPSSTTKQVKQTPFFLETSRMRAHERSPKQINVQQSAFTY
jgi:hypothetical protein